MADLTMETEHRGDVAVIYARGFINAHTVRQFEQEIERAIESGRNQIVVNGSGLSYIASAGLGVIMGHIEDVRSHGGDIRLTNLNETVHGILEVLGFDRVCRVFDTDEEGVASYSRSSASSSS